MTPADYLSAIILGLLFIAAFINIKRGTFVQWLKSKFLGLPRPATASVAPATTKAGS